MPDDHQITASWHNVDAKGAPEISHHHAVLHNEQMYIGMGEAKRVKYNRTFIVDYL